MSNLKITGSEVDAWDKSFHHAFIALTRARGKPPSMPEDQWEYIIELAAKMADEMILVRRQRLPKYDPGTEEQILAGTILMSVLK